MRPLYHHAHPEIFDTGEHDFETLVLEASHQRPILVDFWADWCAPCIALAPVLEHFMDLYGHAVGLGKVEVDDHMRLAGRYKLRGFPTVILFWNGEEKGRFSGARPLPWIEHFVLEHFPAELERPVRSTTR
ncbi:MAG: thioredoxin [Chromatiales bacterium]|nr:thioredoxin [Chromatiales bacterium]